MSAANNSFDSFASEYDFMASLNPNRDNLFISNMPEAKGAALDIGCGSGILTLELAQYYETVVGIDVSEEMLAIAKQKRSNPKIKYILMDAEQLSLNQKFDFIVSANTFHHLNDLPETFEALRKLLKSNGRVVLSDIISKVETPVTIVYLIGAVKDFVLETFKYGGSNALRLFRFRTSRSWLRHLSSDKFLSEQSFKEIYSHSFPDCSFIRQGIFMSMIWDNN